MPRRITISKPPGFSFKHTVQSHGWYDLLPFELIDDGRRLKYVFRDRTTGRIAAGIISEKGEKVTVEFSGDVDPASVRKDVRHILRLDENIDDFYQLISDGTIGWAATHSAGRLLRSATVFEDLVKTLCTTNCSWSLTRKMIANLVSALGEKTPDGSRAFPLPQAMASVEADFYRNEIKAGYRSPYFAELAASVADGQLDPEKWLTSDLPTAELKNEIKKVKGIGEYAADNLLKLLGRYDGLALDSWLRAGFFKKHNKGRPCKDGKIERHYRRFGKWRGLAIWCDMTEDWFSTAVE